MPSDGSGRIGECGPVVMHNGKPCIQLPADWTGPTIQRFAIPANAESGPMFCGAPVLFLSTGGKGTRWYRSGAYTKELLSGPFIDTYGSTFERDRARWRGEPGESIGIRIPATVIAADA